MSAEPGLWQTLVSDAASVMTTIFKAYVGSEPVPATIGLLFGLSWWFNRERALNMKSDFLRDRKSDYSRKSITADRWASFVLLQPFYWADDLTGLILNKPKPKSLLRASVSFLIIFSVVTFGGQLVDHQLSHETKPAVPKEKGE